MARPLVKLGLAAALALLPAGVARAESINFSYLWFSESPVVFGNDGTTVSWGWTTGPSTEPPTGTAVVGATTPTPLDALQLGTNGNAPTAPWSLDGSRFFFEFTLKESETLVGGVVIEGTLSGVVGIDTSTAVLTFPRNPTEFVVGDHVYRVWLPDVAVPAWLGAESRFTPQLTVNTLGSSEQAPEPSTLALGALAGLGLAARRWLRRRAGAS
jgi:hypothetical protein